MNFKKNIFQILFTPLFFFCALVILYLIFPKFFFFRGWEFFETYVYKQNRKLSFQIQESGDSSRDHIIQKYKTTNIITVNKYGNRVACYDSLKKKSVLILGDSQTFGAGLSDNQTLPRLLCNEFKNTSIYNGSRKNTIQLTKAKNLNFNKIFFISAERVGFRGYCNISNLNDYIIKDYEEDVFKLKNLNYLKFLKYQIQYLNSYLQNRSEKILNPNKTIFSPDEYIIKMRHSHSKETKFQELDCIKKLNNLFKSNDYQVAFMYYPSKQTALYKKLNVNLNDETINFIPKMTKLISDEKIPTFDSKKCIDDKSNTKNIEIFDQHDTHLNYNGIKILYNCLLKSKINNLFN
ncbi:hypothetical protein N9J29_01285 [Candidatus Pelagibacter sp.]|nr:hypothetical protein [Candidatus Pelagibacter sp.]MDA9136738.1 hypothetical protein [Candidatus Pelagibacter sp.]